jgi:hypothetical protein
MEDRASPATAQVFDKSADWQFNKQGEDTSKSIEFEMVRFYPGHGGKKKL